MGSVRAHETCRVTRLRDETSPLRSPIHVRFGVNLLRGHRMRRVPRPKLGLPKMGLLGRFAIASIVPIVALGFVLAHLLTSQIRARAVADATKQTAVVARLGIQPQLTRKDLSTGVTAARRPGFETAVQRALTGESV